MNETLSTLLMVSCLAACVPVDQLPPGSLPSQPAAPTAGTSYPDLDAPFATVASAHFSTHGYRENDVRPISVTAESIFSKIANDTGLYSPMATLSFTSASVTEFLI